MIKIQTNGSGIETVIIGCPFCKNDNSDQLRFLNGRWLIDPEWDKGRHSFRIEFCPFCGNKLPNIENWVIKEK